jgi:FlaA1/EpsC-like NDP-sugar epimerase
MSASKTLLASHTAVRALAPYTRWVVGGVQLAIFVAAAISAFLLRFDFSIPRVYRLHLFAGICAWVLAKIIVFHLLELDHGWWRHASVPDVVRVLAGNALGSALGGLGLIMFAPAGFPRSLYFLDFLLCLSMTTGARLAVRVAFENSRTHNGGAKKRTLIYGAGDAGVALLRDIRQDSRLAYNVLGFVDDDHRKLGLVLQGVKVLGEGASLAEVVSKRQVDTVLIAVPSASGVQMTQILRRCQQSGASYKTVPSLGEMIEGNGLARQIRDVAVEDLLGRSPARLDEQEIARKLEGKVVMVTGAAGSIGSEMCRQIARFHPKAIIGYEISETALFYLDLEMRQHFPTVTFYPEIGSIQNAQRLDEVVERHHPSILYHAAAYKHVPLMEAHMFEAVENNVFGTYTTALVAAEHGLEDFVGISTDKAVRPTSVMGVTKRAAELAVNSLQNGRTRFVSVRFGNVLGSNGSVIPLFKKQIAAGGPVTVTHPGMQRYFMTIPEASQLVLQASTMGRGGEIFVLDMGEPVKIVNLARNLILLSGLRPDEDIQIKFTGIRPGEKLYEELRTFEESTAPTSHEKVKVFTGPSLSFDAAKGHVETLRRICAARDVGELVLRLKEIVPEYNPSSHLLRQALLEKEKTGAANGQGQDRGHAETFRHLLGAELLLRTVCDELVAALTPDDCWQVLQRAYCDFGFFEIKFKMGNRVYRHSTNGHGISKSWTVRIQLAENDYLNLSHEFEAEAPPIVARFGDAIGQILMEKAPVMLHLK